MRHIQAKNMTISVPPSTDTLDFSGTVDMLKNVNTDSIHELLQAHKSALIFITRCQQFVEAVSADIELWESIDFSAFAELMDKWQVIW